MKWVIAALVVVVLVIAGVSIAYEVSLNKGTTTNTNQENMGINQITIQGNSTPLPIVNGVYQLNKTSSVPIVISFNGTNFVINSVSNISFYGANGYGYIPNPVYKIVGDTLVVDAIGLYPTIFVLTFTLHYTTSELFGKTTNSKVYNIEIN